MSKRSISSFTNGTAALKMPRWVQSPDEATIIAFPGARYTDSSYPEKVKRTESHQALSARKRFADVLEASEMYSSLRNESFHGCPYGVFSRRAIAALSAGSAAIAVVSLILGLS